MKGSFHQSRRESNFYNNLKPDKQLAYAKQWVATLNSKLLEPFVKITGAFKHNREVFYEIDIERLLKVEKENQRLREAIKFYADPVTYEPVPSYINGEKTECYPIDGDEGEIARKVLGGDSI